MISPVDVPVLDLNSARLGTEPWELMSRAGISVFEEIVKELKSGQVVIVCGPGNNGGDGLVAAGSLHRSGSFDVTVIYLGDPKRPRTGLSAKALSELDPAVPFFSSAGPNGIGGIAHHIKGKTAVVDAILGSGAKGEPKGDIAAAVEMMNRAGGLKVAVDIPTGLGSSICFKADITVTFHDLKAGMVKDGGHHPCCGRVMVRDIGIPAGAALIVGPGDLLRLPVKGPRSKKGETGRLLIVGGGPYTGAPALAAMAAVRTGCDLVRVAVPSGVHYIIASMSPDLIVERLPTHDPFKLGPEVLPDLKALADRSHCVLVGPGSGNDAGTLDLLADLADHVSYRNIPLVLDADGLTAAGKHLGGRPFPGSSDVVLTPHRGELRGLVDHYLPASDKGCIEAPVVAGPFGPEWTKEAQELVGRLSMAARAVILAKGPADLIVSPGVHSLMDHISVPLDGKKVIRRTNMTGVPEMSVGGTGDVLAGLCSGLMACGASGFDSACISAYVNGRAGEASHAELGRSLSASSLLKHLRFSS